jgi:hypothetical protein
MTADRHAEPAPVEDASPVADTGNLLTAVIAALVEAPDPLAATAALLDQVRAAWPDNRLRQAAQYVRGTDGGRPPADDDAELARIDQEIAAGATPAAAIRAAGHRIVGADLDALPAVIHRLYRKRRNILGHRVLSQTKGDKVAP